MKTFLSRIAITGALVLGANAVMAAPSDHFNEAFKKKYGRPAPHVEAILKAEATDVAFREERPGHVAPARVNWIEEQFRAKLGRATPAAEARLKAERESTAFREEFPAHPAPVNWIEEHFKGKLGRSLPCR